jgi:hypothetical protein
MSCLCTSTYWYVLSHAHVEFWYCHVQSCTSMYWYIPVHTNLPDPVQVYRIPDDQLQLQVLELGWHVQQVSTTFYPMSASIIHYKSYTTSIHGRYWLMKHSILKKNDSIMVSNIDIWTILPKRNSILLLISNKNLRCRVAKRGKNVDIKGFFFNIKFQPSI